MALQSLPEGNQDSKNLEYMMCNTMIYDYGGFMLFVQTYLIINVMKYSSFLVVGRNCFVHCLLLMRSRIFIPEHHFPGNDCHASIAHIGFEPIIIDLKERNLLWRNMVN